MLVSASFASSLIERQVLFWEEFGNVRVLL